MEFKNLIYEIKDKIGILTLNRPKLLNALNHETLSEMSTLLRQIKEEHNVGVLIMTGSGEKAFIAGADISEIEAMGLADSFEFSRYGQRLSQVFTRNQGPESIFTRVGYGDCLRQDIHKHAADTAK